MLDSALAARAYLLFHLRFRGGSSRAGTGRRNGGAQRLDAFTLNTLPHMAMKWVCYEVKTSRADFLSELKCLLKRRIGMRYSNEFYFVTPAALVVIEEIPSECWLVEADYATFSEWKLYSVAMPVSLTTIPRPGRTA